MNSIFQAFYKHNPNFIKHMTATSFIQILLVSFQVASAFVMVGIIGMVADREQREQIWLFAVACFLGIVSACLDGIYRQWKANRKEDYLAKTREENLDALLHGEYTKVSRYEPGDLLERMQESSVKFTELFVDNLASFSFQLVRLVIVGGILLWLHPFLTVLLLAVYAWKLAGGNDPKRSGGKFFRAGNSLAERGYFGVWDGSRNGTAVCTSNQSQQTILSWFFKSICGSNAVRRLFFCFSTNNAVWRRRLFGAS